MIRDLHIRLLLFAGIFSFFSPSSYAAQDAMVITEQAIIYSDQKASAPVGFLRRGKLIRIGSIARNKSQVYPIIVSGKIAYIRASDVSTNVDAETGAVTERGELTRFKKQTLSEHRNKYTASFISYNTLLILKNGGNPDGVDDQDNLNWLGVGVKGEVYLDNLLDYQLLLNVLTATKGDEKFRMVEAGIGAGFRFINFSRFKVSMDVQALGVPFASYTYKNDFRVNGYGFSLGGGGTVTSRLGDNWGLEGSLGLYYTKLGGFKPPKKFEAISPGFLGTRLYVGANYQF